jgi:hypothetical protein
LRRIRESGGGEKGRSECRGDEGASVHARILSPVVIPSGPGVREPVAADRFRHDAVIGAAAPRPREIPDADHDNCKRNKPAHAALRVSKTGSAGRVRLARRCGEIAGTASRFETVTIARLHDRVQFPLDVA